MCGIFGMFHCRFQTELEARLTGLRASKLLRHRGPDWTGAFVQFEKPGRNAVMCCEILATDGLENDTVPQQPIVNKRGDVALIADGIVYNAEHLRQSKLSSYDFQTTNQWEVVLGLYEEYGMSPEIVDSLDGMFAFVIWDGRSQKFYAVRDALGQCPLYIGYRPDGGIMASSEIKALHDKCARVETVPPGCYFDSACLADIRWYNPDWKSEGYRPEHPRDIETARDLVSQAVIKCMTATAGILLTPNLPSQLIAATAVKLAIGAGWTRKVKTFAIGLKGSPELDSARAMAEELGTEHMSFEVSPQDHLDALEDTINICETYDVQTVRKMVPLYLAARKMMSFGIKVVIVGEDLGIDLLSDVFRDDVQFTNSTEFQMINKVMGAHGVEARMPLLDRSLVDYLLTSIVTEETPKPASIECTTQKLVVDLLQEEAEGRVSDADFSVRHFRMGYNTPNTKEAYFYRLVFDRLYPSQSVKEVVIQTPPTVRQGPAIRRLAPSEDASLIRTPQQATESLKPVPTTPPRPAVKSGASKRAKHTVEDNQEHTEVIELDM